MRRLQCALLATVAIIAVASGASAADLPAKAPVYKAPVMVVPPSWTGWYVGVSAGYGWGSESNQFNLVPTPSLPVAFDNVAYSDKLNGFIGGGQLGYNYQITPNSWVAGIEADISYTNFKGSDANSGSIPNLRLPPTPWSYNQDQRVEWLATLRGRLGWTPGDHAWLFYATGGLAVGGAKASNNLTTGGLTPQVWIGDASETKAGWTVGGGVEARLVDNWTAKLEYLYYDLGHLNVIGVQTLTNPFTNFTTTTDFGFRGNIVRVGLNKRFTSN